MINIIGGGPIGCYSASLLSKNHQVTIYEENKKIGEPIQCTGILSQTIEQIMKPKKEFIANKVYKARIYAPNRKYVDVRFKKPNIVIYRDLFDQHLKDLAEKNGVEIKISHRLISKDKVKNLETRRTKKLEQGKIIGADGPLSAVSRFYGLGKRKHLQGVQAVIKAKHSNMVEFHPYIGTYAWSVPQSNNLIRVGVVAERNAMKIFKTFSKKYRGKIIGWQGGLIPVHEPRLKTSKKNTYIVGDAAAQIKNTTGGGLIPGLMCAEELSKAINQNKDYDRLWRKRIGRSLWIHQQMRTLMNRFGEKDWNKLIKTFSSREMQRILEKESRDQPVKLLAKAIIRKPQLILFMKKILT